MRWDPKSTLPPPAMITYGNKLKRSRPLLVKPTTAYSETSAEGSELATFATTRSAS